jgi:hypothetical protein
LSRPIIAHRSESHQSDGIIVRGNDSCNKSATTRHLPESAFASLNGRDTAHDARQLGIEPISKLRCLPPESINEVAIVEFNVDKNSCDKQEDDEPWNRHGTNLNEFDAHETRISPHNTTIALRASIIFEQDQGKGRWQFR